MASNAGKRLDRLEKLLDTIATKNKQHHFVVCGSQENVDAKVEALASAGIIKDGDDVQTICIPWMPKALKGTAHIPEGDDTDPYADPRERKSIGGDNGLDISANASSQPLDHPPTWQQEQAWRQHERAIELDGTRYQGDGKIVGRGTY